MFIGAETEKKGLTIRPKWAGNGIMLKLDLATGNYRIPHDDLFRWVKENTRALETKAGHKTEFIIGL